MGVECPSTKHRLRRKQNMPEESYTGAPFVKNIYAAAIYLISIVSTIQSYKKILKIHLSVSKRI